MKKIVVCGLGYVGLTHLLGCWMSACESGADTYEFVGYDPDESKVGKILSGECPISEPGLPEVLAWALKDPDHFRVSSDPGCWYGDPEVEILFCCVGTPMSEDGSADMRYVRELARDFGKHIGNLGALFVNKSTSPVGTCKEIYKTILEELDGRYAEGVRYSGISVVSNPEFLREGSALEDMLEPDRIVIGGSEEGSLRLREFYETIGLLYGNMSCITTTPETAELSKYASNAMLATRISFMNDMADLCEKTGADVRGVSEIMGLDRRIGPEFLKTGPGYGGSCFPKDTRALMHQGIENGLEMRVVDATIRSNINHRFKAPELTLGFIRVFGLDNVGKIGVIGAAFKSGTGDMRESPAVDLLRYLANLDREILVFDELVSEEDLARAVPCDHPELLILSPLEDLKECDIVVIMNPVSTLWSQFWPQFGDCKIKAVIDMRCCVPDSIIESLKNQGVIYVGHGRGDI